MAPFASRIYGAQSGSVTTLAQTPSGNVYVSSCWSLASVDVTTGSIVYNPAEFRPMIYDIALGTDGYLYLLLYGEIRVSKPDTWETVATTGKSRVGCVLRS